MQACCCCCGCMCQWRIRFTLTSCCWGTCWWGHTCRTWRKWHRRHIMKTTEPSASTKWHKWSCRTKNAGRIGQDARTLACSADWMLDWYMDVIMLLVCLRSIKVAARWIFLCHWPRLMRGKDWSMKKMKRCISLLPGSLTFVTLVDVIFSFFPICSWGRCRKC